MTRISARFNVRGKLLKLLKKEHKPFIGYKKQKAGFLLRHVSVWEGMS